MDRDKKPNEETPVGTLFSLVQVFFGLAVTGWFVLGVTVAIGANPWLALLLGVMGIGYSMVLANSTVVYTRGEKGLAWFYVVGGGLLAVFASLLVCGGGL